MFKNYFKTAFRNLQKQKVFALINISGLTIGIACFCLLMLYSYNQLSFDKFNKNANNIYRVYTWWDGRNGQPSFAFTGYESLTGVTLGEAMKQQLPDVISYARIQLPFGEILIRTPKKTIRENVTYADASLFSIFSFPIKYGNANTALHDMNDVVLTEAKAKELFGRDDVVGKSLEIQIGIAFEHFKVSAVAKDLPANSSFQFGVLGNFSYVLHNDERKFIIGNNFHPQVRETFVQLQQGSTLAADKNRLAAFLLSFNPGYLTDLKNLGYDLKGENIPLSLRLQPLLAIHTDTNFKSHDFTDYGKINPKIIWILTAIAIGILLIACINFTTLAIGRSAARCKEVGVRKVIGAERKQIIIQFLTESILLSVISAVLGVVLAIMLLPLFNQLSSSDTQFYASVLPKLFLSVTVATLSSGLISGSYPAFVLSNFKAIEVLKNKIRVGGSNFFTKSLVTFQFTLSIMLIVSTIIILQQTDYMMNKNPGFDKENIIAIDASQVDPNQIYPLFKQQLSGYTFFKGMTSAVAGMGWGQDYLGYSNKGVDADINIVDPDYIKVFGMQMMAGNNFNAALHVDSIKPMIINETMMRSFGWDLGNVVGKQIDFQGGKAEVVGVVKNFNYHSLSEAVKNQAFVTTSDKGYNYFYVRISAGNPRTALTAIQTAWSSAAPGVPIKYSFLDEDINHYYANEQIWNSIVAWSAGISIFLACLGLFGLASLAAINRTKEIGVRKVLGASVAGIIALISKGFLQLVITSFVIATPLAYYFMHEWLQGYANRINISWWVFAIAGLSAIGVALITISFQSIKAAIANPMKSLRTE